MSVEHPDASISQAVRDLEALLERRGLIGAGEIDAAIERFLSRATPANGARIVARAWVDADFRRRLLDDANGAIAELGLDHGAGLHDQPIRVVPNSDRLHNVVVCTLCSCYPVALLGPSPSWYKSEAYRSRVVRDPRSVLDEFGLHLPPDVEIRVWDSSAATRYMVLPRRPVGTDGASEQELAARVTRNGLIGTAAV